MVGSLRHDSNGIDQKRADQENLNKGSIDLLAHSMHLLTSWTVSSTRTARRTHEISLLVLIDDDTTSLSPFSRTMIDVSSVNRWYCMRVARWEYMILRISCWQTPSYFRHSCTYVV